MKTISLTCWYLLICFFAVTSQAQIKQASEYFSAIEIRLDTSIYTWPENNIDGKLAFRYRDKKEIAEVYLYHLEKNALEDVSLMHSGDYELLDSMVVTPSFRRFKVRFKDLNNSDFLKFVFKVKRDSAPELIELALFPYANTYVALYTPDDELFIGEEKIYELTSNFPANVQVNNRWTEGLAIDYRTTFSANKLFIHLLPNRFGSHMLAADLKTKNPDLLDQKITYDIPRLTHIFKVKKGRLAFLQFDRKEVTPNDDNKVPVEIQIDNNINLQMGKTYRIENQEKPGGPLIAEMFTKNRLNNDKILVQLRPYAFHRKSSGYLYIKNGDEPKFVTNIDITPKTSIQQIYIQREGKDWKSGNSVFPGETVNLKLAGEGMHKALFSFPGAESFRLDSLVHNEKTSLFKLIIPKDINSNKIEIFDSEEGTGKYLEIKEYQKAKEFDFVSLKINEDQYQVNKVGNIYYEENISDLIIAFDRDKIDQTKLHGKQYLNIRVNVRGKKNNLIELYEFDQLVICPGENSPRFDYYDNNNCRIGEINLNDFLSKKTFDLEEWSRIDIEIKHIPSKYGGKIIKKKISVILKRKSSFDIDVSFPAGLLILELGNGDKENTFSNFGGISFAMLAQFSFYQPGKIAKYRPYRFGAGFIAIDAFNFSDNSNRRDVGLVGIGALYPASKNRKLTFPLYAGMGYLLRKEKAFFLVGPGIRVNL